MSKSYDNYISLDDSPEDMYGKIMSINDSMIIKYFKLAVFADRNKIEEVKSHLNDKSINPRDVKRRLAVDLVKKYYFYKHIKVISQTHHKHIWKIVTKFWTDVNIIFC